MFLYYLYIVFGVLLRFFCDSEIDIRKCLYIYDVILIVLKCSYCHALEYVLRAHLMIITLAIQYIL